MIIVFRILQKQLVKKLYSDREEIVEICTQDVALDFLICQSVISIPEVRSARL